MKTLLLTILLAVEIPVAGIPADMGWGTLLFSPRRRAYIEYYAEEYSVDPDLITAIVDGESEGEIKAFNVNDNGTHDKGLMQINSFNYEWLEDELGVTDMIKGKGNKTRKGRN